MPNRPPVYLLICWLSLSACLPDCLCLLACPPDCLCQPTYPTVCLHVPLSLSPCLSACLPPDYLSSCLPTCFPTVCLSARVFVCLSYCLPANVITLVPLASLPVMPSAWPVVFPSGRMSKYPFVTLSICLSGLNFAVESNLTTTSFFALLLSFYHDVYLRNGSPFLFSCLSSLHSLTVCFVYVYPTNISDYTNFHISISFFSSHSTQGDCLG